MSHKVPVKIATASDNAPLHIAICGGGASAALLLLALRHHATRQVRVTILEPRSQLGSGLAYSTRSVDHLLNTRAGNMSVVDDPDDFVQWLRARKPRRLINWTREDFAPRSHFAAYLQARLAEVHATAPHVDIEWSRTTADSVSATGNRWEIVPAQGRAFTADAVILATGNEAPRLLAEQLPPHARELVIEDPWDSAAKDGIPESAPVLLVGSGLTAADVLMELLARQHRGSIIAVSPRGLLPQPHGPSAEAPESSVVAAPASLRDLISHVRELCGNDPSGATWRRVFGDLRPVAPAIWREWSLVERKRFLRHARPFWEIHRHRLPPRIHARITSALGSGRLDIVKGRIERIEPLDSDHLRVSIKYARGTQQIDVARIVNCTGPETNPARSRNSLLQALIGDGIARVDPTGMGLAVDADCRVVGIHGSARQGLYAIGAPTRGAKWEVTSILELRMQAKTLIRHLLHSVDSKNAASGTATAIHSSLR